MLKIEEEHLKLQQERAASEAAMMQAVTAFFSNMTQMFGGHMPSFSKVEGHGNAPGASGNASGAAGNASGAAGNHPPPSAFQSFFVRRLPLWASVPGAEAAAGRRWTLFLLRFQSLFQFGLHLVETVFFF